MLVTRILSADILGRDIDVTYLEDMTPILALVI